MLCQLINQFARYYQCFFIGQRNRFLGADGVDFYDATDDDPALLEAKAWIAAVRDDTPLVVTPQQALVVTQILEAIYQSAATGQPVYFS